MSEEAFDQAGVSIHPTALISAGVSIGKGTVVGPWAEVEENVVVGRDCRLAAHAIVRSGTVLGERVQVDSFSVIGGLPQDLHFDPELNSGVRVGDATVIRESVTINRSTLEEGTTEVGRECFLMAGAHVGHDCRVGNHVVLANVVLLAGFVSVGDHSFLGGGAGVHQFCRIGESVMLSGNASISMDIPPYLIAAERNEAIGINLIGLRRRKIPRVALIELKDAFRDVYSGTNLPARAAEILKAGRFQTDEAIHFLEFFADGRRGFARSRRSQTEPSSDA